mgnify:FL=1
MTAPRQHAAAAHDVLFLVALGLMSVALIWLAAASRLAAVGVRMDRLCEQRVVLLHQRSEALAEYAAATSPQVMEHRARSLALGPLGASGPVTVAAVASAPHRMLGGALGKIAVARLTQGLLGSPDGGTEMTDAKVMELAITASAPSAVSE